MRGVKFVRNTKYVMFMCLPCLFPLLQSFIFSLSCEKLKGDEKINRDTMKEKNALLLFD